MDVHPRLHTADPARRALRHPAVSPAASVTPDNKQKPSSNAQSTSRTEYPSPPQIMRDRKKMREFQNGGLIGKGGFARCYEVTDEQGLRLAAKVIAKNSLKNQKHRQKLLHEIKIHSSMAHPYIVQFVHYFEDPENVYLILELCENKTLMEMVRKRKLLTEPEARYYTLQLTDAVRYMHKQNVIHRDLKLGNLFLSHDMQIKVGDFGLATSLKHDGERKKTICGTPNYIAPEILFDQQKGHSFEADIWSMGVILFTMLTGKPPFQTREIKAIYKRIREGDYSFPQDIKISETGKDLIQAMLQKAPDDRPNVDGIAEHPYLKEYVPLFIPISALETPPIFRQTVVAQLPRARLIAPTNSQQQQDMYTSFTQSRKPLSNSIPLDDHHHIPLNSLNMPTTYSESTTQNPQLTRTKSSSEVEALHREMESVSLQPSTNGVAEAAEADAQYSNGQHKINRMLSMPTTRGSLSPHNQDSQLPAPQPKTRPFDVPPTGPVVPTLTQLSSTLGHSASTSGPTSPFTSSTLPSNVNLRNKYSSSSRSTSNSVNTNERQSSPRASTYGQTSTVPSKEVEQQQQHLTAYNLSVRPTSTERNTLAPSTIKPSKHPSQLGQSGYSGSLERVASSTNDKPKVGVLELIYNNLEIVFKYHAHPSRENLHALSALILPSVQQQEQQPAVFISKWIDYSNKYGLGYQLTNGCVGVHFNDSTSIILAANELNFEYLYYPRGSERSVMRRQAHTMNDFSADLSKKVTLLKHFKGYMQENLIKASYSFSDIGRTSNLDFLTKYIRTKHAVVFRLSNHIIQVNFFDHTKLILSNEGRLVTFINKKRDILHESVVNVVIRGAEDPMGRLKYARDVVEQLFNKRQAKPQPTADPVPSDVLMTSRS